jgi:hypothetical protein
MENHPETEQLSVKTTTKEQLVEQYGGTGLWIAYCGNGPAHGLQYGHYALYQGASQDEARAIAVEHGKATGHQCYLWRDT